MLSSTLVATYKQVAAISYYSNPFWVVSKKVSKRASGLEETTYINVEAFHRLSHVESMEECGGGRNDKLRSVAKRHSCWSVVVVCISNHLQAESSSHCQEIMTSSGTIQLFLFKSDAIVHTWGIKKLVFGVKPLH